MKQPNLRIFTLLILACIAATHSAFAADKPQKQLDTPKYSPDYCQFMAKFPDAPYTTKRCEGKGQGTCYDLISYTKVFGLSSSIRVEIICNPSTPAMYKEFTTNIMEKTVRAMTKETVIEAYEVNSRQEENYRQSGLLGRGRKGVVDTIYIAQLWVAENSIMSVEAELIGEQTKESDEHFAQILRNIGYTNHMNENETLAKDAKKEKSNIKVND